MSGAPDRATLLAYLDGRLDPAGCAAVEDWLHAQDDSVLDDLAAGLDAPQPGTATIHATAPFRSQARASRYQQGELLGQGGMALVHRAYDRLLAREVAVKSCRPRSPDEHPDDYLQRRQRFEREVAILAQLEHPGIAPIHDVGENAAGFPAYTMKCLEGTALTSLQAAAGQTLPVLVTHVLRCAEAVAFAHSKGIVHRDIKPENLVVGPYGAVTLVDWGVAAHVDDPVEAAAAGTPTWMAPEQAAGGPPHQAMDIWALGGLLLYCASGRSPRSDGDAASPIAASVIDEALPRGLQPLVHACLDPDPARRPASVAVVIADLQHWLRYGVVASAALPWPQRAWLQVRKHPRRTVAVIALVLVVLVVVVQQQRHRRIHLDDLRSNAQALTEGVALDDAQAVQVAARQSAAWLRDYPEDAVLVATNERFRAALTVLAEQERLAAERAALTTLSERYHRSGRWHGEVGDRLAVLAQLGLPAVDAAEFADAVADHALRSAIVANLIHAYTAARLERRFQDGTVADQEQLLARMIARLVARPDPAWVVFRLIAGADLGPHEPELRDHDLVRLLPLLHGQGEAIDLLLAQVGPDAKLATMAEERIAEVGNAFWPRVFLARDAVFDGDAERVRRHALIAFGHHPHCFWPTLLLAYADLIDGRFDDGLAWVAQARAASPGNLEAAVLAAALRAAAGQHEDAQRLLQSPDLAAHVRYHLEHPHGHPMELACQALVRAGVAIPAVPGRLGPVVAPPAAP